MAYINSCDDDMTFIDLFGGSFYLSYVITRLKPKAKVICNDFDNYRERLNHVDTTNKIIKKIKEAVPGREYNTKYSEEETKKIKRIIQEFHDRGEFIDALTLSHVLIFSGKNFKTKDELLNFRWMWNHIPQRKYEVQWYLDAIKDIDFVCKDWEVLFNEYRDKENVCFIADPPYINTNQDTYSDGWSLIDTLKTFQILRCPRFVYYSSAKSGILDLIEYFNENFYKDEPITYLINVIKRNGVNKHSNTWEDIMICF